MDNQESKAAEGLAGAAEKAQILKKIGGDLEFLKGARDNMIKAEEAEDMIKKLTSEDKKANKNLNNARKAMEDEIEAAWKAGLETACGELTANVNSREKEINKLKNERAASKEKGVADRIDKETEYLHRENKGKKTEIISAYKEDKVPFFCRLRYYFALFAPKGIGDILMILVTVLVAFGAIPMLVWYLIPDRTTTHLIIIYVAAVILFGGIYALVLYFTRIKHSEAIKKARALALQIRDNKKEINAIKKRIRSDEDESGYGLGDIDNKLAGLQKELDEVNAKLEAARNEFENVTKPALKADIETKNKENLDALEAECVAKAKELEEANEFLDKLDEEYENVYLTRIPKEYFKESKLDRLIELVENGDAVSLDSALLIMKSMGK